MYLFDIDGTLLLSGGAGSRAINRIFLKRYGKDGAMDKVAPGGKTDGIIFQECADAIIGRPLGASELEEILGEYVPSLERELATSPGFELMPFARQCLEFLESRCAHLGIATGNIRGAGNAKLARAGLQEFFAFGGFADDSSDRAALVAAAMERGRALGSPELPSNAFVVVGDTMRDIAAARACGARVIAVATGSSSLEELAQGQPDALFASLEELPAWHHQFFEL